VCVCTADERRNIHLVSSVLLGNEQFCRLLQLAGSYDTRIDDIDMSCVIQAPANNTSLVTLGMRRTLISDEQEPLHSPVPVACKTPDTQDT
jgi:hypothetical protein